MKTPLLTIPTIITQCYINDEYLSNYVTSEKMISLTYEFELELYTDIEHLSYSLNDLYHGVFDVVYDKMSKNYFEGRSEEFCNNSEVKFIFNNDVENLIVKYNAWFKNILTNYCEGIDIEKFINYIDKYHYTKLSQSIKGNGK